MYAGKSIRNHQILQKQYVESELYIETNLYQKNLKKKKKKNILNKLACT